MEALTCKLFGDCRMWEFSVGLYMINLWPDSLLFAAIYGVVESASTALFGPLVGQLVDRFSYKKVSKCLKLCYIVYINSSICSVIFGPN